VQKQNRSKRKALMASQYDPDPRPARPWRTALTVAAFAFLGGLALMAWALTRWEPLKKLVGANAPAPVAVQTPVNRRLVAATPAPATEAPDVAPTLVPLGATEARLADLEGRMSRIDLRASAAAGNAARAEGLLIAFAARRALDRGVALGYIEGELRDRFGGSQPRAVAAIIAGAQQPVTVEALHQGLTALTPDLVGGGANEGWWDATRRTLNSLIVVRKAGTDSPAADDRIERAQLRLQAGQVESALAEIARLPAREKAADWMAKARRYIEAHRALDIIEAAALTDTPKAEPAAPAAKAEAAPDPEPAPAAPVDDNTL
jgi:hypothetical protein